MFEEALKKRGAHTANESLINADTNVQLAMNASVASKECRGIADHGHHGGRHMKSILSFELVNFWPQVKMPHRGAYQSRKSCPCSGQVKLINYRCPGAANSSQRQPRKPRIPGRKMLFPDSCSRLINGHFLENS